MAKQNEPAAKAPAKKSSPFKTVSEQLKFWPELSAEHNAPFTGVYVNESILGDDPDPAKQIPVFIFADVRTGEKFYLVQSYAIKKAVAAAKKEYTSIADIVFNFEFIGKTTVNGKPFNQFNTGYCTLSEYNEFSE